MMGTREAGGPNRSRHTHRGFSLVLVVTLMMLLSIIALGLLQLSAVTLRGAYQDRYAAEARANARVALMMALSQLQREMGPDQRISAPAGILDTDPSTASADGVANPRFIGVWKAGEEVTAANMDTKPGNKRPAFRSWLVSSDDAASYELGTTAASGGDNDTRIAVGTSSVADPGDQVRIPVIDGQGAGYAWWTSDNGQKAALGAPGADRTPPSQDLATTLASSRRFNPLGHHAADASLPGEIGALRKLPSFATTDVAASTPGGSTASSALSSPATRPSRRYFHDLTDRSELVPVDVTAGRLRSCMNLWLAWLEERDPAARAAAGTLGPKTAAARDFRLFSWDQFRHAMNFCQDASKLSFGPTGRPRVTAFRQTGFGGGKDDAELNPSISRDRWRIQPVLLKTFHIVSYSSERVAAPPRSHALRLHVYPVMVLWNPYNVDLVVPEYSAGSSPLPVVFTIKSGSETTEVDWVLRRATTYASFGPEAPQEKLTNLVIPAGATRVLYPQKFDAANPTYHRHSKFPHDFYFWMQHKDFDCGPGNYGGPFLNLKTTAADNSFVSSPGNEITGEPGDLVRISVKPSVTNAVSGYWPIQFQWAAEHTDWHGNNGSGTDDLNTILRFNASSVAGFRFKANSPQVSVINEDDVPARSFGTLEGTPTPLMIFECYRKPMDEDLFPSKNWAFSMPANPIHAGPNAATTDMTTPWHESAYTFRFKAVNSWVEVAQRMQLPPDRDDEAFMGGSYTAAGQMRALAQEIPIVPPVSLAQLQHLPLFDYRPEGPIENPFGMGIDYLFHRGRITTFPQNNAIGNSYASPGIPSDSITAPGWPYFAYDISHQNPVRLDRSYVANKLLWDRWWCSSLAPQDGPFQSRYGQPRKLREVARQFLSGEMSLPDDACQARLEEPTEAVLEKLFESGGKVKQDAWIRLAAYIRISGGFNVNSVSVKAWEQLYAKMLSRSTVGMESVSGDEKPAVTAPGGDGFLVSRFTFQGAGASERATGQQKEERLWNGCRELTGAQITALATETVRQVKKRGPFLSLADFINRGLSSDTAIALKGPLQAAIDDSGINQALAVPVVASSSGLKPTYPFPAAAEGPIKQGIPGWVTQADLLQVVGPMLAPRSDTFTIRAMGEARDKDGKVLATSWCEAVVQRGSGYFIPSDPAERSAGELTEPLNKIFGRRFDIVSFRWLANSETR